jgi:hypothetical protein
VVPSPDQAKGGVTPRSTRLIVPGCMRIFRAQRLRFGWECPPRLAANKASRDGGEYPLFGGHSLTL